MQRGFSSVCAAGVTLLLAGCEPWPPFEFELRENFERNHAAFVAAAEKLEASDYRDVSWPDGLWGGDSEVLYRPATFPESLWTTHWDARDEEQVVRYAPVKADAEWLRLMMQTGALSVSRNANDIVSFRMRSPDDDVRSMLIAYQRSRTLGAALEACEPAFRYLDCGRCKRQLSGDWYVLYAWHPADLFEPHRKGGVDQPAIDDVEISRRLDACYAIGDEAMGYESDPFKGDRDTQQGDGL